MQKGEYIDEKKKDSANEKLGKISVLKFEPSDIKYIIVEKENEIINIISEIEQIESYNNDQKKLLCSRVISSEQILEDF